MLKVLRALGVAVCIRSGLLAIRIRYIGMLVSTRTCKLSVSKINKAPSVKATYISACEALRLRGLAPPLVEEF